MKIAERARQIIERTGHDAIGLLFARHSLDFSDPHAYVQGEEEAAATADVLQVLVGDDTGCADPEDQTPENATHLFAEAELRAALEEFRERAAKRAECGFGKGCGEWIRNMPLEPEG